MEEIEVIDNNNTKKGNVGYDIIFENWTAIEKENDDDGLIFVQVEDMDDISVVECKFHTTMEYLSKYFLLIIKNFWKSIVYTQKKRNNYIYYCNEI